MPPPPLMLLLFTVLTFHKLSQPEDLDRLQQPPEPGHCRIVLADDVAQCGLTFPSVRYVVDTGLTRDVTSVTVNGTEEPALQYRWISRSSALLRASRASRTGAGMAIRLYPRDVYYQMAREDAPEMIRAPLDRTMMMSRAYMPQESLRLLIIQVDCIEWRSSASHPPPPPQNTPSCCPRGIQKLCKDIQ